MPPLKSSRRVLPAGYAAVELKLTGPNTPHPPSFGFAVDSDVFADVSAAVSDWLTVMGDSFLERLYTPYTVDRMILRSSAATEEYPLSLPGVGVGAALVTPAVSALIKTITATPGKRGNGRMYWPGCLDEADVDNAGTILAATRTSLQAVADNLYTTLVTASLGLVLLHSYSWTYGDPDPGPPMGFPAPSVVTAMSASGMVATQRRRQR